MERNTPVTNCPLIRAPCSEGKCNFWVDLTFTEPGQKPETNWECIFKFAIVMLMRIANSAAEKPKPQIVVPFGVLPKKND